MVAIGSSRNVRLEERETRVEKNNELYQFCVRTCVTAAERTARRTDAAAAYPTAGDSAKTRDERENDDDRPAKHRSETATLRRADDEQSRRREATTAQDRDPRLTHVDGRSGDAHMVDVSGKRETRRTATAVARVRVDGTTARLIAEDACKKGDVLAVARLAGICAAKRTWQMIPLCHQVRLDAVTVDVRLDEARGLVRITATAVSTDRTGVEMESLTACAVAALTVYDMCKAVSRDTVIEHVKLLSKTGGKADYARGGDGND